MLHKNDGEAAADAALTKAQSLINVGLYTNVSTLDSILIIHLSECSWRAYHSNDAICMTLDTIFIFFLYV